MLRGGERLRALLSCSPSRVPGRDDALVGRMPMSRRSRMAYTIRCLDDGKGALLVAWGTVDGPELLRAHAELYASEEKVAALLYRLSDYSGVERVLVTGEDIVALAELHKSMEHVLPDCVVAVVGEKDVVFGLGRMWQARLEIRDLAWETRVFRARSDAETWIRQRMREKHGFEATLA
jgi:hypothetical protein